MDASQDHNKIIRQAAREVLEPLGLFQKGQSRMWIDDNGWFLILVEFQPSGFSKGSYLTVAISYLWESDPSFAGLSFNYPVGGGSRQNNFVPFTGDGAAFYEAMTAMAQKAASLVEEYRKFRDLSYARNEILSIKRNTSHDILNMLMICGLAKDPLVEKLYRQLYERLTWSQQNYSRSFQSDFEFADSLDSVVHDPGLFQARIVELINERRNYLHTKPSYKKLDPAPYAPPSLLPPPYSPPPPKKVPWWRFWDPYNF